MSVDPNWTNRSNFYNTDNDPFSRRIFPVIERPRNLQVDEETRLIDLYNKDLLRITNDKQIVKKIKDDINDKYERNKKLPIPLSKGVFKKIPDNTRVKYIRDLADSMGVEPIFYIDNKKNAVGRDLDEIADANGRRIFMNDPTGKKKRVVGGDHLYKMIKSTNNDTIAANRNAITQKRREIDTLKESSAKLERSFRKKR